MLNVDEYKSNNYSSCSLSHCGIVKLTAQQALNRLNLGKEKLSNLYQNGDYNESEIENLLNCYC